jgi:serine/threonine protein kinase
VPGEERSGIREGAVSATVLPLVVPAKRTLAQRPRASLALSGLHATSPEALRRRLIGPWAEGLRQYLTLELGDARRGTDAFAELKRLVLATPTSELVREPGAKARVYRLARRIAHDRRGAIDPRSSADRRIPYRAAIAFPEAVERLRTGLAREHAELLELRFARELVPVELACVLGTNEQLESAGRLTGDAIDLAPVERALEAALAAARALAGTDDPAVFVEAFALVPHREDDEESAEKDSSALEPGTLVGGRYRLLTRVGVGAFGDVYKADDQDVPGHRVALKVLREPALSQAARDDALRELKLIAAVFHPSVVVFKDHGWFEDRLWFVMPWYDGATLDKRIKESGGLGRAEARAIFEPLARALATLHANGIRHQDIKPDNVLLARIKGFTRDEDASNKVLPILLDLGVAAKEHEALIGGTPVYFAPEVAAHYAQRAEAPEVGPKADVFALALSLRNALEPETEEDVPAGAIEAFIERRAEQAPAAPVRRDLRYLRGSFDRWLAADPAKRPSAEELARELAILTAPEERRSRLRRTLSWLLPLLMALSAVFVAVVYVLHRESELQQREIDAAHQEIAAARADLLVEESRRLALDSDHAVLLRRYEESNLSRDELASQLATSQSQVDILGGRLAETLAARDALSTERDQLRTRLLATEATARQLGLTLAEETERGNELEARAREAREEHARVRTALEEELATARRRADEALGDLDSARGERDRADARVRELEGRLEANEAERAELEQQIEELRQRVATLRSRLEQRSPSRDPVIEPPPELAATHEEPVDPGSLATEP